MVLKDRHHGRDPFGVEMSKHEHDYTVEEMINGILTWADESGVNFDTKFVEDQKSSLKAGWTLSIAQIGAIERIFRNWKVAKWLRENYE